MPLMSFQHLMVFLFCFGTTENVLTTLIYVKSRLVEANSRKEGQHTVCSMLIKRAKKLGRLMMMEKACLRR